MKWYHSPYFSEGVKKKYPDLIHLMDEGTFPSKVWVIIVSPNGEDLLDIRKAISLSAHGLADLTPMVVGASLSKGEALSLVEQIVRDCLNRTGGVDLRAFLGIV